jgi:phage repressor protein C with HTH and peptisase S24 domain
VSLIRVVGDSMQPVLNDGDDIMVDRAEAFRTLRDGIHVIRLDGVLMVKRLARAPGGLLSVLSDNPAYPSWPERDPTEVELVGRVVWVGRRL